MPCMIIISGFHIGLLLAFLGVNIFNYYMIRDMIWSIVWCDKGGKYNSLKKLKEDKNIFQRLSMKYLGQYTNGHRKEFVFWLGVKSFFVISQIILLIIYVVSEFILNDFYCDKIRIFVTVQSFVVSVVLMFQSDTNRETKYDRMRRDKKSQK